MAANNLKELEAETIDRLLLTFKEDLSDEEVQRLADVWMHYKRLVADEFSMVGRKKLGRVSRNLNRIF